MLELVDSLTAISQTLLQRPGKCTLENIKRVSEINGFTSFTDKTESYTRLSIAGTILLIDVDVAADDVSDVGISCAQNVGDALDGLDQLLLESLRESTLQRFAHYIAVLSSFDRNPSPKIYLDHVDAATNCTIIGASTLQISPATPVHLSESQLESLQWNSFDGDWYEPDTLEGEPFVAIRSVKNVEWQKLESVLKVFSKHK